MPAAGPSRILHAEPSHAAEMAADFTVTGRPGADHTGQPTGMLTGALTGWPRKGAEQLLLAPDKQSCYLLADQARPGVSPPVARASDDSARDLGGGRTCDGRQ